MWKRLCSKHDKLSKQICRETSDLCSHSMFEGFYASLFLLPYFTNVLFRYDWGALILVDERFSKNPGKYIKGLSKWVRQKVKYYTTFQQAALSLKDFTKERLEAEPNMEYT